MGSGLQRRIKQVHFRSPQQEALLNLSVAAAYLREQSERVVEAFDITLPQYNVLRILRGVHPNGHPRGEIAMRMLDRAPDVTRIVDRLSAKNLVERDRNGDDKRQSITRITREGLKLLDRVDPPMQEVFDGVASRLSDRDSRDLSRLCELLYDAE
ncbi:MAG TPA: MarR family transcriptional regulator [Thermoanaerobaculia bacterium]|nr:MarR family transcriptional regulator [Thermoanaerobaculia bacterium]